MRRYSMDLHSDRVVISNDVVGYKFKNRTRCANCLHVVIPLLDDASKNIIDLHDDNELSVIPHDPLHVSIKRDFANGSHVVMFLFQDTFNDTIDAHSLRLVSRRFALSEPCALRYVKVRANCLHVVIISSRLVLRVK